MVWVNLLPWRRENLHQQRRRWCILLLALLIILAAGGQSGYWHYQLNRQQEASLAQRASALNDIAALQGRTLAAQQQLTQLQKQQKQQQQRQQDLDFWLNFTHQLETHLLPGIWLLSMKKNPQGVELQGMSQNINDLYHLRDQLSHTVGFQRVKMGAIRRGSDGDIRFSLQALLNEQEQDYE